MKNHLLGAAAIVTATAATPALASEGGRTAYPNGAEALTIAALPPPGTYLLNYGYYYTADRLNDDNGNSAGPPDFSVNIVGDIPRFVHVTNFKVLGASVAMQAFVPIINVNVHAGGARQNKFGIGDIIVNPLVLGWQRKNTFFVATMDTFVPTGSYKRTNLANLGNNYWTFQPVLAVTHFNPKGPGPEVSLKLMYDFNTKNRDTNYRSGQAAHVDFAAAYNFNPLTVGITGYYLKQTTDAIMRLDPMQRTCPHRDQRQLPPSDLPGSRRSCGHVWHVLDRVPARVIRHDQWGTGAPDHPRASE